MLDTCFHCPEKYIVEALEANIKFKKYKVLEHAAIRKFYSLLRAAMIGVRGVHLLPELINEQMLPGITRCMPPGDWK
jgi:hypothetical protein